MQVLLTLGVKIDILTIFFVTLHGVRAYSQALLPSLVALRLEEGQISTWLPAKRSRVWSRLLDSSGRLTASHSISVTTGFLSAL